MLGVGTLDDALALCPALQGPYEALWGAVQAEVPPRLRILCAHLVAELLGALVPPPSADDPALPRGARAAPVWRDAAALSAAERAVLGFAEHFVLDPHTVSRHTVRA